MPQASENKIRLAYAGHGGIAALGWWGWWGFGGYGGVLAEIYAVERKLRLFPDFTYHFEIDGYSFERFAESRDPEVRKGLELLKRLVQTGRVEVVGGTYAGPFAPLCDSESLIRQFEYGLSAYRNILGLRPATYYSQEPNYTLQSPRIFRDFGYRDVLLRFEYNGEVPRFDAEKVTWRGLDGTRIDVLPIYRFNDGSFCHNPPGTHMVKDFLSSGKFGELGAPRSYLAQAKKHGVRNPLILFCRDVTHYHFSDVDARRVRRAPLVEWTTLRDQCRRARKGPKVFLQADDIKPVARFGWLGDEVRKAGRKAVRALYSAEFLDAVDAAFGGTPSRDDLDAAWKEALIGDNHDALFFNHGLGFMIQDGTDRSALRIVASAGRKAAKIGRMKLRSIAALLRSPRRKGTRVIVANTLPWPSTRVAKTVLPIAEPGQRVRIFDGEKEVSAEILEFGEDTEAGTHLATIAFPADFDGAGYKCFYVKPSRRAGDPKKSRGWRLDSSAFTLELSSETGAISRLVDKVHGTEYGGPLNLYKAYFGELRCWSSLHNLELISSTQSALGSSLHLQGELVGVANRRPPLGDREVFARKYPDECPFPGAVRIVVPFDLRLTLDDISRAISFEVTFDFPLGTQIGESFYGTNIADINAQIERARYALRALFAVPPARSISADLPFGAASRELAAFPGVTWCRAEFGGKAITIVNDGTLGYTNDDDGIGNMLAMASPGVHGSSTKDKYLYAYLAGKHAFHYWLLTDPCTQGPSEITRKALELTTPLITERAGHSKGSLPEKAMLLCLSDGVVPTCLREKQGLELRLYEASGSKRQVEVALHERFSGPGFLTRLDGRKTRSIGEVRRRLSLDLKPWQIVTVRLEPHSTCD